MIQRLRGQLREALLILSLFGVVLMCGPVLQSYYPIEDAKTDLIRFGRRIGRRSARKLHLLN